MTHRQISVEISKLLREAIKQDCIFEVFCDIGKMFNQSCEDYIPDEDFDEGIDILNR